LEGHLFTEKDGGVFGIGPKIFRGKAPKLGLKKGKRGEENPWGKILGEGGSLGGKGEENRPQKKRA